MKIAADVSIEGQKSQLVDLQAVNEKKLADAKSYTLEKTLKPYKEIDWKMVMALNPNSNSAPDNIGIAFRELAENSEKIGTLNITSDLLEALISHQREVKKGQ